MRHQLEQPLAHSTLWRIGGCSGYISNHLSIQRAALCSNRFQSLDWSVTVTSERCDVISSAALLGLRTKRSWPVFHCMHWLGGKENRHRTWGRNRKILGSGNSTRGLVVSGCEQWTQRFRECSHLKFCVPNAYERQKLKQITLHKGQLISRFEEQ